MNSDEISELFHGKEIVEKEKIFRVALQEIESRHFEYFQSCLNERDPGHDLLHNHWIMLTSDGRVTFNFIPDSDLDEQIKQECFDAFKQVYLGVT